jgi:hypothetical protein
MADTSSITVRIPIAAEPAADYMKRATEEALSPASDALAVLSLFQRAQTTADMSLFNFGLELELFRASTMAWATQADGGVFTDWSLSGGQLPFELSNDDERIFRADPRFAYLSDALQANSPSDWQRRTIATCRVLRLTSGETNPQTQILLAAVALESLLGDSHARGGAGTGRHQLARRACFVWCGAEAGDPHGPNRGACPYLLASTGSELARIQEGHSKGAGPIRCSYYGEITEFLVDRGSIAHGGESGALTRRRSRAIAYMVEQIFLCVLNWVVETGATDFGDYEDSIRSLQPIA